MRAAAIEAISRLQALQSLSASIPTLSGWIDQAVAAIQKADEQESADYLSAHQIAQVQVETLQIKVADLEAKLKDVSANPTGDIANASIRTTP